MIVRITRVLSPYSRTHFRRRPILHHRDFRLQASQQEFPALLRRSHPPQPQRRLQLLHRRRERTTHGLPVLSLDQCLVPWFLVLPFGFIGSASVDLTNTKIKLSALRRMIMALLDTKRHQPMIRFIREQRCPSPSHYQNFRLGRFGSWQLKREFIG
jgi:hypothetical protein